MNGITPSSGMSAGGMIAAEDDVKILFDVMGNPDGRASP